MSEDEQDEEIPSPDPNVYQLEEDDDELEIDRRIRRAHERLRRLTIVGSPDIDIGGAFDEGGLPGGYALNYKPLGACCLDTGCRVLTENQCNSGGGKYIGHGTACIPNPCGGGDFVCGEDHETITITLEGIINCPDFFTDDMNGSFVLTVVTPGIRWSGPGADFVIPDIGTFHTNIDVVCPEGVFAIDYRDSDAGEVFVWFIKSCPTTCPPPPPYISIPNDVVDCSDPNSAACCGTASITIP